jgi:hypothetical protein
MTLKPNPNIKMLNDNMVVLVENNISATLLYSHTSNKNMEEK